MKTTIVGGLTALALASVLGAAPAAAASCPPQAPANPAFAAPRPCSDAPQVVKPKPKSASGVEKTTTPDGKTQWRTPDTTVTVSGSVSAEFGGRVK